jgi:sarcosine oxidase
MTSPRYDVIVLGVGTMGSAALFELARRGRRVLGLEQFVPGHDRGSSTGQTRVIRKAYYEHPDYVPLLRRAFERWYDLEQRCGRRLFVECGCLSIGPADGELVPGVRRAADEHGLPVDVLTATELRRRCPAFRFGDDMIAVLERNAGFLYVEECVSAHADEAQRLGADLHTAEPALSWEAKGDGTVVVRTAKGVYAADRLVVTAGAWAGRLLSDLGLPLTVLRKVLLWFSAPDPASLRRDVFPIYMAETPAGFYYGFPVIDDLGHKVGRHDGGTAADPTTLDRNVTDADAADCAAFLRAHLPAASGPRREGKVCMYTVTPDRHFLMDCHPRLPQVIVAAGFSGHGFKFAPVVGEVLADLAENGRTDLPVGMFRIGRPAIDRISALTGG